MKLFSGVVIFLLLALNSLLGNKKLDSLNILLQNIDLTVKERIDIHSEIIKQQEWRGKMVDSLITLSNKMAIENGLLFETGLALNDRLSYNIYKRDFTNHLSQVEQIDSIANLIPNNYLLKELSNSAFGYYFWKNGDFENSIKKYEAALQLAYNHEIEERKAYLHSALAHKLGLNNQFYEAIYHYNKVLNTPNARKAIPYGNLTNLYKRLEDWENGLKHAKLTYQFGLIEDHKNAISQSRINWAMCLYELSEYEASLSKVAETINDQVNPPHHIFYRLLYSTMFRNLLALNRADEVIESINLLDSISSKSWDYSMMLSSIGKAYLSKGNTGKAIYYCEEALVVAEECGHWHYIKDSCECLSKAYEEQKEFKKMATSYKTLNDAINNIDNRDKVMNLSRAINKQELKQQEDLLALEQEKKDAVYKATIGQYKIGGALGSVLLFSAFIFLWQLRKRNTKIISQNEIIRSALEEKDILLREIHHRVKNNLQVISSLLSLQSRQIKDKKIKQAISEGRNRVRSMALIHQNLYQKENLTGISVQDYLHKLTTELFDTYNVSSERVNLKLEIEDIDLDVDTMVPLGLIINEMVSNALKHAFPDNKNGQILVRLVVENDLLELVVADNGVGVNEKELIISNSFGNRLIQSFAKKLKATLNVENDSGTKISMQIKNFKKAA